MAPDDPIRAEIDQLRAERDQARRDLSNMASSLSQMATTLAQQNDKLDQVVSMLRRRENEKKRLERENRKLRRKLGLDPDPEPPEPDGSAAAPPEAPSTDGSGTSATESVANKRPAKRSRRRTKGGRRPPPDHLPKDVENHAVCGCAACGGRVFKRDTLVSKVYTVVPSYVRCREIRREWTVCADPGCNQRTTAPMPPMPCERALYDCRFLAWLVVMKFVMLVPLDRIRTLLLSQGVDIAMGTLVHLIARATTLADGVDGEHWKQLRAGSHICFDGTGLKTLVEGQDKAWPGYLEVFTRDELTVFQFSMTKHADGLAAKLAGFEGMLVSDAESRNSAAAPTSMFAYCNAHPLRKFREAEAVQPKLASQGKRFLQTLYDLEDEARDLGLEGDELVAFRQRKTRRVLRRFKQWLGGVLARPLPPSDPVRKVANYYLKHFDDLSRFVDHAELPLDNNASEREFQRHAKLRYASLFAGSPEGAHRWATLLGVVRTAQKCDLDVLAYLTWMFERRGTHRDKFGLTVAQLTPMAFRDQLKAHAHAAAA